MTGHSGKLIIFSAPSGAGKTTIVQHLLKSNLDLEFSISAASRKRRSNEVSGKDYYFIPVEEFKKKIKNDDFLEWEEVYTDHFYGTLKSEVERIWANGKHVIFDVDVIGGLNIKKFHKERALAVFVMPPTAEHLEQRLRDRSTENETNLKKRIEKAEHELTFANKFDKIIVNDNLDEALREAREMVNNFLNN